MTDTTTYDDAAYVLNSNYRQKVITTLRDGPANPKAIAEDHGVDAAHISRAIAELRERDVVDLLVSEDVKKGRYYALTEHGEAVVDEMEALAR